MSEVGVGALRMGTAAGRWVLATTVLGSGVVMIDATVVNVALARIGRDLGAGFSDLQWTINAYTLALASLILLGGSLGDRLGRRRVFVIGVAWFAVASLLCGLAPNVGVLIAARALQGVGGALLTPGSLALISASFHGADRSAAIGAWSGLGGVAGALGPFLGGWLVEWTWRAVFLINIPVAALVIAVAVRHVPESRDADAAPGLDVAGVVLGASGLGSLTYGLTVLSAGVGATGLLTAAVGVAALVAFVLVERRSAHPLVPPALFANRVFSAANLSTLLIYGSLGVVFLLLVLQLQTVAGFSPIASGTVLLPLTVIMLLFSARVGALAARIGPRPLMTAGPLVAAGGLLLLLRVGPGASWLLDVLPAMLVFGSGIALTVAPLTATVLDAAPDRFAGSASGVNNAVARAAGLLSVAVIPGVAGITGDAYTDPVALDAGFRSSMVIAAGLLLVASVVSFLVIRRPRPEPAPDRVHVEKAYRCELAAPAAHPADR